MTSLQQEQPIAEGQLWRDRLCGSDDTLTIGARQGARWQVVYGNGLECVRSESTIRELYALAREA